MTTVPVGSRISLSNILYLTDFSAPSQAALSFGVSVAREYGAALHAFHVLTPTTLAYTTPELAAATLEAEEEAAEIEMQRIESQLAGVVHDTTVKRGFDVWPTIEDAILEFKADLIVLGTHGRTGPQKLVMGSVAEEIFRRSPVPVLTIGPAVDRGLHSGGRFHRILFATDFTPESLAAAPWAISMAQENQARLVLLNVLRQRQVLTNERVAEETVANSMYHLHELIPPSAELWCRPEAFVQYGDPAHKILEVAQERGADLIIVGVREATGYVGATTHLARTTAQHIVAHSHCPVLTVRGQRLERATAKVRPQATVCGVPTAVVI
ncbi:MAG TPA: universal stress protein [Candidatus Acidoferrales bacterium]|nr:universal stress protein [Candidatus Acidoferrales bacterium]